MDDQELKQANWYILNNFEQELDYLKMHKDELREESAINLQQRHREQFPMMNLHLRMAPEAMEVLYALACGPHHLLGSLQHRHIFDVPESFGELKDYDELDIADNVHQEDETISSKVYKRTKELSDRDDFDVDVEDLDATLDEYCNDHEETQHVHDPLDYDSDIWDG
ncbi:hypothetical protein Ancab_016207 [Ancistrocladus abbreviatus]